MISTRTLLLVLVLGVLTFAPTVAFAADATFFGPIVPPECNCEEQGTAPDWGCVMQVLQNGVNFMVSLGIIIFTLSIAYAGALYMGSAGNPVKHSQAVGMIKNTVLGILVLVSAWLLVDFVMGVLYDSERSGFGPWEAILADGDPRMCLEKITPPAAPTTGQVATSTASTTPKVEDPDPTPSTGTGANCPAADPSNMVAIPASATSGDAETATAATVERFLQMRAAAAEDGIDLKVTDGYRSDAEQVQLWNQNGCADGSCERATARPCSLGGGGSNHNSGEALDISVGCSNGQSNCNTATYNWLRQNGPRFNFRNSLPDDPLHWSPTGR